MLFLHGLGGDARSWEPQLEFFSPNYRAAAWDMPGYGKSLLSGDMTFEGLSDSLASLLDDRGWNRVHLVGHSLGGMVAQEFAVCHQDRLRSLTLFATSPAFGRPDGDFQKRFVAARLAPLDQGGSMNEVARRMTESLFPESADPAGRALAEACMSAVPEATYRAAVACIVTFDCRHNLPRLRVPTLILSAAGDTNAPAPMMKKMSERITGSRYVCLPDLGHLANLENPRLFNAALEEFLNIVAESGAN